MQYLILDFKSLVSVLVHLVDVLGKDGDWDGLQAINHCMGNNTTEREKENGDCMHKIVLDTYAKCQQENW